MPDRQILYYPSKISIALFWFWAILCNSALYSEQAEVQISDIQPVRLAAALVTLFVFIATYQRYFLKHDRLEIRNVFNIRLPLAIVFGPRISKHFAIPLWITSSTMMFSEITELAPTMAKLAVPAIGVKVKNKVGFRLPLPGSSKDSFDFYGAIREKTNL